ncbi:MAG: hypothetical protein M4D80_27375 [Myxococcota bacterium]|nr:hypothetical protein [Deltaproteobacteria bacterium]MDQ3338902.1 hypothetical protein [Myxococcota bacterium]
MLSVRVLGCVVPLVGCQGTDTSKAQAKPVGIEVLDVTRSVVARVVSGRPCRATVDGVELLVGGRPLVAQVGTDRWTGEDAPNGTTLKKNDQIVARIHAKQLFDANGIPIIRVMENGDIADRANAVVRKAVVGANTVTIDTLTVTGTTDVALAAFLTSRETVPEVRALAACHYLIGS